MQEDVRNDLKSQLALMIARGKTINAWASQNDVPLRTAYRWSREPQVRGRGAGVATLRPRPDHRPDWPA